MSGIDLSRFGGNIRITDCYFDNQQRDDEEAAEALEMSREELDRRAREGTPARIARREPWGKERTE